MQRKRYTGSTVTSLADLGWSSFFEEQVVVRERGDLRIVRVVEQQRGLYAVDGEFEGLAEVTGHLLPRRDPAQTSTRCSS